MGFSIKANGQGIFTTSRRSLAAGLVVFRMGISDGGRGVLIKDVCLAPRVSLFTAGLSDPFKAKGTNAMGLVISLGAKRGAVVGFISSLRAKISPATWIASSLEAKTLHEIKFVPSLGANMVPALWEIFSLAAKLPPAPHEVLSLQAKGTRVSALSLAPEKNRMLCDKYASSFTREGYGA